MKAETKSREICYEIEKAKYQKENFLFLKRMNIKHQAYRYRQ